MNDLYQQIASLSPEQRALFEQRLQQRGIRLNSTTSASIPRRNADTEIPLSFAQQRLWFVQQLDPDNVSYNVPSTLKLEGSLNLPALQQTFDHLVQRHEALRTRFTLNADQQPIQIIDPPQPVDLPLIDLSHLPDPDSQVQSIVEKAADSPFDLSQTLLRLRLIRINAQQHILLIIVHHIISDRWSVGVFLRELTTLYNAFVHRQPSPLPDLPIQAADWAIWQRQILDELLEQQIAYWKKQLRDLNALELPLDHPRPAVSSYRGDQYPIALSKSLSQAVKTLAAQSGTTLFTALLTSLQILLHRYTQEDDIVIGTDIANRDRSETAGLIGLLVNTVVLRADLSGNPSFRELLERSKQIMREALAHQDLPFEKLVELINPDRSLSQMMPLFQVKLDLQLATVEPPNLTDLRIERITSELTTVKYELRLNLQDSEQGINGQIEYSTDLFERDTIARLAEHFKILLAGIVANPDCRLADLPLLTVAEQQQLMRWNQTDCPYPDSCIHQLFEAQVERTPDTVALIWQDQQLTYSHLNAEANQLANYLRSLSIQPEMKVAVCLERTPLLIIALLAILKAGAAYVPLDPAYPQERHRFILEDAEVDYLFTQSELSRLLPDLDSISPILLDQLILERSYKESQEKNSENLNHPILPANLAYLIYTSGSTGQPKAVAIEHRNTLALLHWALHFFPPHSFATCLAASSLCFDLSLFEIFAPLACGGTVLLADSPLALPHLPHAHHLTLLNTVPSAASALLRLGALPPSIHTVTLAGEALPQPLVQQLYQCPSLQQLYNLYGPSEATTYSTAALVTPAQHIPPIGRPIANTQAHLLDRYGNRVPVGVIGELYLSGAGVTRGYYRRAALTAEGFVPGEVGERQYRTGDRCRYLPNGELEYLGRVDHQVKLRGFRIELGEIEARLNQHPDVIEAVVIVQQAPQINSQSSSQLDSQDKTLNDQNLLITTDMIVAYIVISPTASIDSLRYSLKAHLPSYMLPSRFVQLEALPRLPNGKLNRHALPTSDQPSQFYVAPETQTEQTIATLWQQQLGIEQVGRYDNFFELGGHSLLGMTVMAQLQQSLQVNVPLRYLFQAPTVAELAALIDSSSTDTLEASLPVLSVDPEQRHQPFPLTDIQQAYWIGRNEAFELGNIATHGYREIETVGLTVAQVEQALQQLIDRHEMLRVIVQPDGQQRILAEVEPYRIRTIDLRGQSAESVAEQLAALRNRLSHQVLSTDTFPLFDIQAAILEDHKIRFCISFDVLIGDAWSFQILGQELIQLLDDPTASLSPLTLSFRDYVLAEQRWRTSIAYQRAEQYWQQRLPNLPPAPELPLAQNLAAIDTPQFVRRSGELSPMLWQRLQQTAAQFNLTSSGVLLAAFAEVLSRWSRQPSFTLNLTLFNRLPLHPEVNRIVGDFTSSLLLGINPLDADPDRPACFATRSQQLQLQLWQDLDHRHVSGVEVMRWLSRQQQRNSGAIMPVVFTSILHHAFSDISDVQTHQHQVIYSLSQTSQVYLDHQVAEVAGRLVFNWDAIDALFPAGLLDDMFAAYQHLLERLAQYPDCWHSPESLLPMPQLAPIPLTPVQPTRLHDLFFQSVARCPDYAAIFTSARCFTYRELQEQVNQVANAIINNLTYQLKNGTEVPRIAITMEKGWEQIVAVLAVLAAGAAYVPIDPTLPSERRQQLLNQTQASLILTQSTLDSTLDWPDGPPRLTIPLPSSLLHSPTPPLAATALQSSTPHTLAYILYTSGSTGQPKGVMINHAAVVNTILDINQRFHITATDRIFGLSSLSFDLSVYDIFGAFAAGAALILPNPDKTTDPLHWQALLAQHQGTVWNSVPALMQLGLGALPASLRLVLLSGDWIPLNLPAQIWQRCPTAEIISLGGATEAAIWSIYHPITQIESTWKSIPYGRPLQNQQVYVLNSLLELCPTWVIGELYIRGAGLAQGYWSDETKTNASFIHHPHTGERLYKTGDLGRYLPDGTIEFLGREDFQVKINGQRIELGEIEACLQQHPLIKEAVVAVSGADQRQQLVAYIVPKSDNKLDLKLQQSSLRPIANAITVSLPDASNPSSFLRRQTHRQFLPNSLLLSAFGGWLSGLRQISIPEAPLPKYRYASAGSLYPVQTYLYVKPDHVAGLAGLYYYHPVEHQLVLLDPDLVIDAAIYGSNQAIFEQAGFALFLIADLTAITSAYGKQARDFCLLEAGYIGQLLMETATEYDIGLCPIGRIEFESIQKHFQISSDQPLLHSFVGGAIDPAWTEQISPAPSTQSSIPDQLRQYLQQHLPAYMVPTVYRLLDALPLTANGKIDRRALPVIQPTEQPFVAPRSETEQQIAAIWQQALDVESIGIHDNFFDLGGNSLSATQVLTQIRQRFQSELSIRQFFTTPTIAELARNLSSPLPYALTDSIPKADRTPGVDNVTLSDLKQLSEQDVDTLLQQILTEEADS